MEQKPITLSWHVKEQMQYRGCVKEEIVEAIRSAPWQPADLGRQECRLTIPYNWEWNGKHYKTKTIRPIFSDEKEAIVVVTVYVYYKA